jgi:hypothetical protein
MEKEQIKTYILNCKREAEDATSHRREAWKELWDLYQNKQDNSNKMPWQSKCFIPRVYMTIEQASSVVKRAVMSARSLWSLESKDADILPVEAISAINDKFVDDVEESNFADVYGEDIKTAFLLGCGVVKCLWDKGLTFESIERENIFIDPKFKPSQHKPPKYIIERKVMDLAKFKKMAKKVNKSAKKDVYDTQILDKLEEDYREQCVKAEEMERKGLSEFANVNSRVEILEYWGDIVDDDKQTIQERQLVVLVNGKYIIRHQKNPFRHGRPPYTPTVPVVYPHRGAAGISLVEPIVSLQYTLNNAANMLMDNLNFSTNKSYEVNVNQCLNPQNLTQLYPGKLVKKNTANRVIDEVKTSNVGQDVFASIDMLHKFIEKGTAVTEFVEGSAGKTKTLGETQIKTAQAQGWFDTIARDLERMSLAPLIKMAFSVWVQFSNNGLNQNIMNDIRFKVGGLSVMVRKQEQSRDVQEAIVMSMQSPELNSMTKTKDLWKKYLDIKGLGEMYTEKEPQAPTMDQRLQVDQKATQDAQDAVANMTPEQQMQTLQRLQA